LAQLTETLSQVALELRERTRLSQRKFAAAAGVGKNTITNIESGKPGTTPATLRLIAEAAVREVAGEHASDSVERTYSRLMRLAGFISEPAVEAPAKPRPVEDLEDEEVIEEITRRTSDPELSAAFLAVADDWTTMSPSSKRMVLFALREAVRRDEETQANDARIREMQRRQRGG
jgi:transcriptional regulator with XRE-family HTH domain